MEVSSRIDLPMDQLENVKIDPVQEGRKISESPAGSMDDSVTSFDDEAAKVEISSEAIDLLRLKKKDTPALDEIDSAKITRFPKLIDSGGYNMAAENLAENNVTGNFKRIG